MALQLGSDEGDGRQAAGSRGSGALYCRGLWWQDARVLLSYGEHDGLSICEFPDNEHAMAGLMALNAAAGAASTTTTPLLTSAEATAAMHLAHDTKTAYRPPQG